MPEAKDVSAIVHVTGNHHVCGCIYICIYLVGSFTYMYIITRMLISGPEKNVVKLTKAPCTALARVGSSVREKRTRRETMSQPCLPNLGA